jgi:hypothetical protein
MTGGSMVKRVTKPVLLAWLKAQADETLEGLLEDIYQHLGSEGDWEIINDDTSAEALALLVNHESEVVKVLAKNRLAGYSVSGPEVQQELYKLLQEDSENNDKCDMQFKQGRFYTIAKLYEDIGEKDLAIHWKSWAWFDPYD